MLGSCEVCVVVFAFSACVQAHMTKCVIVCALVSGKLILASLCAHIVHPQASMTSMTSF